MQTQVHFIAAHIDTQMDKQGMAILVYAGMNVSLTMVRCMLGSQRTALATCDAAFCTQPAACAGS